DPKSDPKITKRRKTIMAIVTENPNISIGSLAERIAVSYQTVKRDMHYLTEKGYIRHIGPKNGGQWEIIIKELL
ncbi:MAG: HTH domain-containing protein, partial [Bacteroidales bacterium]|nr:HTH domain-containing protein [Bacteroidales bacterium]